MTVPRRAVELDPDDARSHHWLAWVLLVRGQADEARRSLSRARQIDPEEPILATATGTLHLFVGDTSEAVDWQRSVVEQHPRFARGQLNLGLTLAERGEIEAAREHLRRARDLQPDSAEALAALAHLELTAGHTALGQTIAAELRRRAASCIDRGSFGFPLALVESARGDRSSARHAVAEALASRGVFPPHLLFDPRLSELRDDPRTLELLARFGFPNPEFGPAER